MTGTGSKPVNATWLMRRIGRRRRRTALIVIGLLVIGGGAKNPKLMCGKGPKECDYSRPIDEPELHVPHPRLHERDFVLGPLAEVAPDLEVPGKGKVETLRARLH